MKTITKNVVLEIKKNVECPELGFTHYGKWGGSSREQRLMTNALCDDWLWRYEMLDDLVMRINKVVDEIKYFELQADHLDDNIYLDKTLSNKLLEILKGNEK